MDEIIPSIWDGWEKQCFERLYDSSGAYCAMGYANYESKITRTEAVKALNRIGRFIQAHFDLPEDYLHPIENTHYRPQEYTIAAIVYANNVLRLTPEQFRSIDRISQIEEMERQSNA